MYFEFIKDAAPQTEELRTLHESLYELLKEAEELYRALGRLCEPAPGRSFNIISPHDEFEALFGRKADRRRKLYNGMIKCQLYMYFK